MVQKLPKPLLNNACSSNSNLTFTRSINHPTRSKKTKKPAVSIYVMGRRSKVYTLDPARFHKNPHQSRVKISRRIGGACERRGESQDATLCADSVSFLLHPRNSAHPHEPNASSHSFFNLFICFRESASSYCNPNK